MHLEAISLMRTKEDLIQVKLVLKQVIGQMEIHSPLIELNVW